MIVRLLFTKDSPSERQAADLARELARLRVDTELVEGDSPEGTALTELYDLPSRPAAVLLREDGQMIQKWVNQLPLASDISYLAHI